MDQPINGRKMLIIPAWPVLTFVCSAHLFCTEKVITQTNFVQCIITQGMKEGDMSNKVGEAAIMKIRVLEVAISQSMCA